MFSLSIKANHMNLTNEVTRNTSTQITLTILKDHSLQTMTESPILLSFTVITQLSNSNQM